MSFLPKNGRLKRVSDRRASVTEKQPDPNAPAEHVLIELSEAVNAGPVIPDDWRSLSWNDLRSLAAGLSADDAPIKTKAEAVARIEAELQARAS